MAQWSPICQRWRQWALTALVFVCVFAGLAGRSYAQESCDPRDTHGVYLLTMSPGGELFTVFGHNAIYVNEPSRLGVNLVFNYGVFDSADPDLLEGFLRGTQDYWLGTRSYESMIDLYVSEDRTLTAKRLDLPEEVVDRLVAQLQATATEENAAYRYHWYSANCSTKLRDVLDDAMQGDFAAQHDAVTDATVRSEILRHAGRSAPLWFGMHFVLSNDADTPLTRFEAMFMPDFLARSMADTTVQWPEERRPMLGETCVVHQGSHPEPLQTPPAYGVALWCIGLGAGIIFLLLGFTSGWPGRALHALLLVVWASATAPLGVVSAGFWVERALTVFWANETLMLANPGAVLLVPAALLLLTPWSRGHRLALMIVGSLAGIALLGAVFSLVRGLPQSNGAFIGLFLPGWLAAFVSLRATLSFTRTVGSASSGDNTPSPHASHPQVS